MTAFRDLSGEKFGRLVALARAPDCGKRSAWRCQCECGAQSVVTSTNLARGHTLSCGCLKREIVAAGANTKHGMRRTRTYRIWCHMKNRCLNPNYSEFFYYGGRGIGVCSRWKEDFVAFVSDMGTAPAGLSIDRIDNGGNYEPGNCRWATAAEQANNRGRPHARSVTDAMRALERA